MFDFIFVLRCYTVKKCQLEKVQKHFSLTRGTLHCFSVFFTTDGGIARVFPRPPPMKHHLQTWRYFHRLFHLIRFQQRIPYSMHECTRMGQTVRYRYMVSIHVSPAQRGVSCDHVSGINLSPAHPAVKFADLYSPTLPSHCCRRLKNFEHQRGLAILQVASCCHTWHQGLDGISQPLELLIWNMVSSNRKYMHSSRH